MTWRKIKEKWEMKNFGLGKPARIAKNEHVGLENIRVCFYVLLVSEKELKLSVGNTKDLL